MSLNKSEKLAGNPVKKLDIRGKLCPMTFVYTKLALEEMKPGEIIEVLLDFPPALDNIPDSCSRQNLAKVMEIKKIDKKERTWQISLKKL